MVKIDRISMINTLEAISSGKLKPEDLKPLIGGLFVETAKQGEYDGPGGKKYSQKQLDAYCKKFDQANERRASFGLSEGAMMVVFSSVPIEPTTAEQKVSTVREPIPEPKISELPDPEESFDDAIETTEPATGEAITPEIIKDPAKPKRFNLMGELIEEQERDRERARKMNQWKRINSDL